MKTAGMGTALIALISGLIAAWYWYRSSKVQIEPMWPQGSMGLVEPGETEASQDGWIAGTLLEVKTTNGSARTPFFVTRNECAVAMERPTDWRIYRVHLFATKPQIFTIAPPLEQAGNLQPETWRMSF